MKIQIVYESKTGNTKLVAQSLRDFCQNNHDVIFESVEDVLEVDQNEDIDLYFLGSWTKQGDCGETMKKYCKKLDGQKVAIFGTSGFGGSKNYYQTLASRFSEEIPSSNEILGSFYCQGKMPSAFRDRYEALLTKNPKDKDLEVNIENFDEAQSHPDEKDLENVKIFAKEIIEKI